MSWLDEHAQLIVTAQERKAQQSIVTFYVLYVIVSGASVTNQSAVSTTK